MEKQKRRFERVQQKKGGFPTSCFGFTTHGPGDAPAQEGALLGTVPSSLDISVQVVCLLLRPFLVVFANDTAVCPRQLGFVLSLTLESPVTFGSVFNF